MTDETTTQTTPSAPPGDRWDVGALPTEPEEHTAISDREGQMWQRIADRWYRAGQLVPLIGPSPAQTWRWLLVERGPLVRLVPADDGSSWAAAHRMTAERGEMSARIDELETTVRNYDDDRHDLRDRLQASDKRNTELLAELDRARNDLNRYRGTPPLRDAAKSLVMNEYYGPSDARRGELVSRLRAALASDGYRSADEDQDDRRPGVNPEINTRRKAVVAAARRLHMEWLNGSAANIPTERWSAFHDAVIALDTYVGRAV